MHVSKKYKVMAFNRYFDPGFRAGGPVRTLINMAIRLDSDFSFYFVAIDRDKGDKEAYAGVTHGLWQQKNYGHVYYLKRQSISILKTSRIINEFKPDLIYLNSYFDWVFTLRVLIAKRLCLIPDVPVLLAPRGEFSPGALGLKGAKKRVFIKLAKLLGLYSGVVWQASSKQEYDNIVRVVGLHENVGVAMDLPSQSTHEKSGIDSLKVIGENQSLRICFLSRIVPMKNLDYALRVLSKVSVPVDFSVYGPIEDRVYWQSCLAIAESLPKNVKFAYLGEQHPSSVDEVLSRHDLFFLPTLGENYGHVIHEALSSGLPVLISDRTPWNSIPEHGAGWVFSLDNPEEFINAIELLYDRRVELLPELNRNAIRLGKEIANQASTVADNRSLLLAAISRARLTGVN